MNPAAKKELLAFSNAPKPPAGVFKGWKKTEVRETPRHDGNGIRREVVEVPAWGRDRTISWMRQRGGQLVKDACDQGWHVQLMGFVSHQHRLPTDQEIEQIIIQWQWIERYRDSLPAKCADIKERLKDELLAPLEMKIAS